MTRDELVAHNRRMVPNVVALVEVWRAAFPGAKLIHGVDHETQCEVGRVDAERLRPEDLIAKRCDRELA